jgi:hypothetical protein
MSDTRHVKVCDLKPGDVIDLGGDVYADPNDDDVDFQFEYVIVAAVKIETSDCTCIYLESCNPCGFPPDHTVSWIKSGSDDDDLYMSE